MAEHIERTMLMGELTSAEMQKKMREMTGVEAYSTFLQMVNCAPAADVAPVQHGKWKPVKYNAHCSCGKSYGTYHFLCSACNHIAYSQPYRLTYCPNCGAKMDKEDTE